MKLKFTLLTLPLALLCASTPAKAEFGDDPSNGPMLACKYYHTLVGDETAPDDAPLQSDLYATRLVFGSICPEVNPSTSHPIVAPLPTSDSRYKTLPYVIMQRIDDHDCQIVVIGGEVI